MRMEVHKFGGTSVGSAERIASVAALIKERVAQGERRVVVVASAMTRVTDQLLEAAALAAQGERRRAHALLQGILERHLQALDALVPSGEPTAATAIQETVTELGQLVAAAAVLGELSPRTRDRLVSSGEKLSVRLVAAALKAVGVSAQAVDADTFLETDDQFGNATPLQGVAERTTASALRPLLEQGVLPVVTGFTGRAPDGATTTLGRGGSDLTATFLAAALGADEVTIWTDVDGVFSADPQVVPDARVVPQLNFREAAELSFYGAKVLYQRTMIPVAARGIPVLTRNSFSPSAPGTVINGRFTPGSHPVKAISAVRGHALLSVEGKGMAGVPGVAARAFAALAEAGISVTMICQSSSEASITLAVPSADALAAEAALKTAFGLALAQGDIEEIATHARVGLVAAVGLGMKHTRGVAARLFSALAANGISVLAIAQGSSELNISFAVEERDVDAAIRAVHATFGLDRRDTGRDTTRDLDLVLLGVGRIGRALVEQVLERSTHLFERFGLRPRVVAAADRSGVVARPAGFSLGELRELLDAKASGRMLSTLPGAQPSGSPVEMVAHLMEYRLARPILVDVSDSDDAAPAFELALRRGADVVTANKKPLAGPFEAWLSLQTAIRESRRLMRAEATVGAGLPVIDTLEVMMMTGDRVQRAEGALSGTLGFIMHALEEGAALSEAVREAIAQGYTEPDPVADLCGADVARKATIIARFCGLADAHTPLALEGLVDASLAGTPIDELLALLRDEHDARFAQLVQQARDQGQVLRYVARVEEGRIEVGPRSVPTESALGTLRGTDNMIVFHSERYSTRPLVISGPGAGIEVTAMGVLGDILRIAAERR